MTLIPNKYNCPECKDTGIYQGLNTVEPCRACGGRKPLKADATGFAIRQAEQVLAVMMNPLELGTITHTVIDGRRDA